MKKLNVAVVGLGRMGRRWVEVAALSKLSRLKLVIDLDFARAREFQDKWGCEGDAKIQAICSHDIDAVVIATPNVYLAPITKFALENGKHVLCEKPAGISLREVRENWRLAKENDLAFMVGFNHRFHPALAKAKELVSEGMIGELHFIRGVYGNDGPGCENEWRQKPELAGGGELLDQGVHLIDLANYFSNLSFVEVTGSLGYNFWSNRLEDNAFVTLKAGNARSAHALLHVSWTQWQKKFLWEIYGSDGSIIVEGLGGQYGLEKLQYRRKKALAHLEREVETDFPPKKGFVDPDISLYTLWQRFSTAISATSDSGRHAIGPSGFDAIQTLEIVDKVYRQNHRSLDNEKSGLS